jgi:hypothetical protein
MPPSRPTQISSLPPAARPPNTKITTNCFIGRRIKVLEILDEGRYGSLCEMRPRRVALGEMSPLRLLEAIRGSADISARVES